MNDDDVALIFDNEADFCAEVVRRGNEAMKLLHELCSDVPPAERFSPELVRSDDGLSVNCISVDGRGRTRVVGFRLPYLAVQRAAIN